MSAEALDKYLLTTENYQHAVDRADWRFVTGDWEMVDLRDSLSNLLLADRAKLRVALISRDHTEVGRIISDLFLKHLIAREENNDE